MIARRVTVSAMILALMFGMAAQPATVSANPLQDGAKKIGDFFKTKLKEAVDKGKKAAADYAKDKINQGKSKAWDAYLKKMLEVKEKWAQSESFIANTVGVSLIDLLIELVGNLLFGDEGPPDA